VSGAPAIGGSWKRAIAEVAAWSLAECAYYARRWQTTLVGRLSAVRQQNPAEWEALLEVVGVTAPSPDPLPPRVARARTPSTPPTPPTPAAATPPLWTVTEVQRHFKVSRRTIYEWMKAGTLPYIMNPGGKRRFDPAVLTRRAPMARSGVESARHTTEVET
jgi:excisionase family DNA binding protein